MVLLVYEGIVSSVVERRQPAAGVMGKTAAYVQGSAVKGSSEAGLDRETRQGQGRRIKTERADK